jgi:peptidoglycan/LPS O-acetylase OafA/YrhL
MAVRGEEVTGEVRQRHWAALDGLRGLAAVMVVTFHFAPGVIQGGSVGVDVFFVLSGFLITGILAGEAVKTGTVRLRGFYSRRARRLLPALGALMFVAVVMVETMPGIVGWARHDTLLGIPFVLFYAGNWAIALGISKLGVIGPTWSLGAEEQFYLLWPFAVIFFARRWRPERIALVLGLAAVLDAGYRAAMVAAGMGGDRIVYGLDTRADGLLLGSALAFWYRAGMPRPPRWLTVGAGAALALIVLHPVLGADVFSIAVLSAGVLVAAGVHGGAQLLRWSPARWIGRRSYGLYLWHFPVALVVASYRLKGYSSVVLVPAGLAASVAIAAASWKWLEEPILSGRRRPVRAVLNWFRPDPTTAAANAG